MPSRVPSIDALRKHYADGLTNPEIAAIYGVHKRTPGRWCKKYKLMNPWKPGTNKYHRARFPRWGQRKGWEKSMRLRGLDPADYDNLPDLDTARTRGDKVYRGKPCKSCKSPIRYVSSKACIACNRRYAEKLVKAGYFREYWENYKKLLPFSP